MNWPSYGLNMSNIENTESVWANTSWSGLERKDIESSGNTQEQKANTPSV